MVKQCELAFMRHMHTVHMLVRRDPVTQVFLNSANRKLGSSDCRDDPHQNAFRSLYRHTCDSSSTPSTRLLPVPLYRCTAVPRGTTDRCAPYCCNLRPGSKLQPAYQSKATAQTQLRPKPRSPWPFRLRTDTTARTGRSFLIKSAML
jgi:hypothetical protein